MGLRRQETSKSVGRFWFGVPAWDSRGALEEERVISTQVGGG